MTVRAGWVTLATVRRERLDSRARQRGSRHVSFRRVRLFLAVTMLAGASVATPAPAAAVGLIYPSTNALQIATKMATDSVTIASASFDARPTLGNPTGYASGEIAGFGVSDYAVLSTGNVDDITDQTELGSTNLSGTAPAGRGTTVRDATILRVNFTTTDASANCVLFDFKFLSKEVPRNVGSAYNDAFLAQLDSSSWNTTDASEVNAPGNFGYDPGWGLTSVNSTGRYMSAASAVGTVFDASVTTGDGNGAATGKLTALKSITPGAGAHSLYLSLFDQVSAGGDSAVLIDTLRATTVANPAVECAPPPQSPGNPGFSPGAGAVLPPLGGGATLTLTTKVTGGTASAGAWVLTATGKQSLSGIAGSAAVTAAEVSAGTYLLSTTGGSPTYATSWSCTAGTLVGRSLTLDPGTAAVCTLAARYIDPFLKTGTFVISDRAAKVGATVTFWSPSWASRNVPSQGRKVPEFRGFASAATTVPPKVGATWRGTGAASAKPPRTLPRVIAVVVTSSVRKSGTRISGNVVRIVLIRRGTTFGTGKVIAVLAR